MLVACFWLAVGVSTALLLVPGEAVLAAKVWVASWLPYAREIDQANWTAHSDKVEHALLFAALGCLGRRAWQQPQQQVLLWGGLVVLGAVTEWLQAYVPGRAASRWDWLADVVGLALGWWLAGRPAQKAHV